MLRLPRDFPQLCALGTLWPDGAHRPVIRNQEGFSSGKSSDQRNFPTSMLGIVSASSRRTAGTKFGVNSFLRVN